MVRIMYLNPVGHSASYDPVFAEMAAQYKLPDTEVQVTSLPDSIGRFTHIEYRSYEAMVTAGILRATRAAAREDFDALAEVLARHIHAPLGRQVEVGPAVDAATQR